MMPSATIRIIAAIVLDAKGRILLVRKRGTEAFMQPGGKIERGEAPTATLARELAEELGRTVLTACSLGRFSAPAANEPGHVVEADLYLTTLDGDPVAQAEIDAICWLDPVDPGDTVLAPLTRMHALPLARSLHAR